MKRNNFTHSTPATTMKIILLIMVFSLVLATVLSQKLYFDGGWREDNETRKWQLSEQYKEILKRMTRKPESRQFFGLMGKRGSAKSQVTRPGQKFESFVGLVGKRAQRNKVPSNGSPKQLHTTLQQKN
ncbi:protachykinin-like [Salvelinus fontinalis]|uniref:protachykinin-like n=1 Tax=Salvelinus fontinalis TaxID=8038 RepID=UPI002485087E|nr:protachykinin-like [Salvelinus fontinalis]